MAFGRETRASADLKCRAEETHRYSDPVLDTHGHLEEEVLAVEYQTRQTHEMEDLWVGQGGTETYLNDQTLDLCLVFLLCLEEMLALEEEVLRSVEVVLVEGRPEEVVGQLVVVGLATADEECQWEEVDRESVVFQEVMEVVHINRRMEVLGEVLVQVPEEEAQEVVGRELEEVVQANNRMAFPGFSLVLVVLDEAAVVLESVTQELEERTRAQNRA